ncbi:Na+/H+ antiporter NhaA [Marinobacterium jannaschii]|uniref:Na+/H+ antiporter NhaA n=1 Tax=Marinobacterium jannaschii TaxID=64970 RepID=UPI000686FC56|nr:Na+/H+ antiporter NhaA [Marinobacterium jannaschii]
MQPSQDDDTPISPDDYDTPLEQAIESIRKPFATFLHDQGTSSILLFASTVLALWMANSTLADAYSHFFHTPAGLSFGDYSFEMSLSHWINDGLMPLFFFVLGLEIKREFLAGEFTDLRASLLVIYSALGGMAMPALIYLLINNDPLSIQGWGIPMATDTAFALGALIIFGKRIPQGLITLLVAIAIVDDMGAVLVIALFYTDTVYWWALGYAAIALGFLVGFNMTGVRQAWPYFIVGTVVWAFFLYSGVHTTVAGILVALTVPARPKHGPYQFIRRIQKLLHQFEHTRHPPLPILGDPESHRLVEKVHWTALHATTPLRRWERTLETPVGLFVLPIFALANAGIPFPDADPTSILTTPITLGIVLALIFGKCIGITGSCLLAVKFGIGKFPTGVTPGHIVGMSLIAGMGFTMSIFIGSLAFSDNQALLVQAKAGILSGSLLAGLTGIGWLWIYTLRERRTQQTQSDRADNNRQ